MKKRRKKNLQVAHPFRESVTNLLKTNEKTLIIVSILLYVVLSFLTFNLRISEGGDDSTYIIRALNLIQEGKFPKFQGPLYPVVLSVFALISGPSILIFKLSSWLFLSLSIFLLYKTFKHRISEITLWGTVFILIVNHHVLYFGSQTYSEAFFMALQGLFFVYFFRVLDFSQKTGSITPLQSSFIAILLLLLTLTRTIAIVGLPAVIIFLIFQKQKKAALLTTLIFIALFALFIGIKSIYTDSSAPGSEQFSSLLLKNPYHPSEGKESLNGFFVRFAENSNIYISKYFPIFTGFKPAMSLSKNTGVVIFLYAWFVAGLFYFFKRNKFLFFTGIYIAFMLGATFFALHSFWDQGRLIIPFLPLMIVFLVESITSFTKNSKFAWKQKIPIGLLILTFTLVSAQTFKRTDFSAVFKNIGGDRYYGYTTDWQNYLKMVNYTANELPENTYVACRKPGIARLHSNGKKFYGIYRFDSENPDSLMTRLHENDVTHIIAASLRKNPRKNTGQVINTIHRYMNFINNKYPKVFILKKKIGEEEPSWLFEINYEEWPGSHKSKKIQNNNTQQ